MAVLRGVVCAGKGKAQSFTQLEWVRKQFRGTLGFDPYPGTLNLQVVDSAALAAWRAQPGISIEPSPGYCAAKCFRVHLNGQIDAVWIIPAVSDYPEDAMELIASVRLRDALGIKDGDTIQIQIVEREK